MTDLSQAPPLATITPPPHLHLQSSLAWGQLQPISLYDDLGKYYFLFPPILAFWASVSLSTEYGGWGSLEFHTSTLSEVDPSKVQVGPAQKF